MSPTWSARSSRPAGHRKVSVGDAVVDDKLAEEIGSSTELQPLMLVGWRRHHC